MYKLGPAHQGIVERGSKTASDSYMLWPAKVGAFTVVMGRHYRNSDTSDLPFSYMIEHEDESILAPGVNLRSVGTVRDAKKWPKRDKRKDPKKLDLINFKLLSPYTVQKMLKGIEILSGLESVSGETSDYFTYHSVKIESSSLKRGIGFYKIGTDKFLGNCLINRLTDRTFKDASELCEALKPETDIGCGRWLDIAGMFAPEEKVYELLEQIESGVLGSLDQVTDRLVSIYEEYPVYEWAWAINVLQQRLGKEIENVGPADIITMVKSWKEAVLYLDRQVRDDAGKEFTATAMTGYGIDSDQVGAQRDFEQVRGNFEGNSFVSDIDSHMEEKSRLSDELIERLEKIV